MQVGFDKRHAARRHLRNRLVTLCRVPIYSIDSQLTLKGGGFVGKDSNLITVLKTSETQKALSISARVEEVAAEIVTERKRARGPLVQACVYECASLAKHWRATIEYFTITISDDSLEIEFRDLRDILMPAAVRTRGIYLDIQQLVAESTGEVKDVNELSAGATDIEKITSWLETWPSNDFSFHKIARESIARGEFMSDEELAKL